MEPEKKGGGETKDIHLSRQTSREEEEECYLLDVIIRLHKTNLMKSEPRSLRSFSGIYLFYARRGGRRDRETEVDLRGRKSN